MLLADLDVAVEETARALGDLAASHVGDCASEVGVTRLLARAHEVLGEIDLFCANAGVEGGRGLDSSEEQWATALEVNVMAHVRAARVLVPGWVERGHGRFVVTASAAGLLTMSGARRTASPSTAPSPSPSGCGRATRTRGSSSRPSARRACAPGCSTTPARSASCCRATGRSSRRRWPTGCGRRCRTTASRPAHPEVAQYYAARATDPDRWLAGMNRLQTKLEEAR